MTSGPPAASGGHFVDHSDAGSQYTSIRYTDRLSRVGAVALIGTVGDSYDTPTPSR